MWCIKIKETTKGRIGTTNYNSVYENTIESLPQNAKHHTLNTNTIQGTCSTYLSSETRKQVLLLGLFEGLKQTPSLWLRHPEIVKIVLPYVIEVRQATNMKFVLNLSVKLIQLDVAQQLTDFLFFCVSHL